jgi:hypothetical protein
MEGSESEIGWRSGEGGGPVDLLANCLKSAGVNLEETLFKFTLDILNKELVADHTKVLLQLLPLPLLHCRD